MKELREPTNQYCVEQTNQIVNGDWNYLKHALLAMQVQYEATKNVLQLIGLRREFGNLTPYDGIESGNFTVDYVCALAVFKGYQLAATSISTNYDVCRESQLIISGYRKIIKVIVEQDRDKIFLKIISKLMDRDSDPLEFRR